VAPAHTDDPLGFDEMLHFLEDQGLMRQKIPEQLESIEEVPRNASGKILKQDLRRRFS
jgi:non-ribosomal peptide synthetase component E (peptide arylation enzyme)